METSYIELKFDDDSVSCTGWGRLPSGNGHSGGESRKRFFARDANLPTQLRAVNKRIVSDQATHAKTVSEILGTCSKKRKDSTDWACGKGFHCLDIDWERCPLFPDWASKQGKSAEDALRALCLDIMARRTDAIAVGDRLFNRLLPHEAQRFLERRARQHPIWTSERNKPNEKKRGCQAFQLAICLQDESTTQWASEIPWNLMTLKNASGKRVLLGEVFAVWVFHNTSLQCERLMLHAADTQRNMKVVFLRDGSPDADREEECLRELLHDPTGMGCQFIPIPQSGSEPETVDQLLQWLCDQNPSVVHIAAHASRVGREHSDGFWQKAQKHALRVKIRTRKADDGEVKDKTVSLALDQIAGCPFRSPPFVFMHLCSGAETDPSRYSDSFFLDVPARTVVSRVETDYQGLDGCVRACLANRWRIAAPDAIRFAEAFYEKLITGGESSLAEAATQARRALGAKGRLAGAGYELYGLGNTTWFGRAVGDRLLKDLPRP